MLVKVQNQFDIKLAHEILEYDHFKMVRVIIGGKYYDRNCKSTRLAKKIW